jgi:hypothetical protein
MKWEKRQLIIILSSFYVRPKEPRDCCFCGIEIYHGEECLTMGIVDRLSARKRQEWACNTCAPYFENPNPEDCPAHVQSWLYENRFSEEIWQEN